MLLYLKYRREYFQISSKFFMKLKYKVWPLHNDERKNRKKNHMKVSSEDARFVEVSLKT